MVFGSFKLYAIAGGVALVLLGSLYIMWDNYQDLKEENETLEIIQERTQENVQHVDEQIQRDTEIREVTREAVTSIRKDKQDDETKLSPDLSDAILKFNSRMQSLSKSEGPQ